MVSLQLNYLHARNNQTYIVLLYLFDKRNKAFVRGAWRDSEDGNEPQNDATCLMTIDSQEVQPKLSISNNDLDIFDLQKENEELIRFNKNFTKTFKKLLKEKCAFESEKSKILNKVNDLEIEVKKLINDKEVVEPCQKCDMLTQEVDSLKNNVSKLQDEALNFSKFKKHSVVLDDMLSRQKLSQDKKGLGFSKSDKTTFISLSKPIMFAKEGQNGAPVKTTLDAAGRNPSLEYFRVFGCKCVISQSLKNPASNDSISYNGIFLGYSQTSKAYIVLNKETLKNEESLNVMFDESILKSRTSPLVDDDMIEERAVQNHDRTQNPNYDLEKVITKVENIKEIRDHPIDQVIGEIDERTLRSHAQDRSNFFAFSSTIEPKNIKEAIKDESWTMDMQEELDQFLCNNVWDLVLYPLGHTIIGTKRVYRNKLDENGVVCRNKTRLLVQCYNQQEGIDYDDTYASVSRLESIRILLTYECCYMFKLYQMDVKSAFLNGVIDEEVYVAQPPGFVDYQKPNHVYKLKKALYRLKQVPKA
ncbi:retrovirus-related pol polyprotein from transposon TNT 1-94, partial [Tanacetum coccineum]